MMRSTAALALAGCLALPVAVAADVSELLPNGGFESGPALWTEVSWLGWPLILDSSILLDHPPQSGQWAAWLGGDDTEIAYIQQQVAVPPVAPVLGYWHWIDSNDDCGYDFAWVIVDFTTVIERYDLCATTATGGWVLHTVDLESYAGRTLPLQVRVETDDSVESSLFVDNFFFTFEPTGDALFRDGFESGDTAFWVVFD